MENSTKQMLQTPEPFKQWLAQVGYERIEETEDPELSFDPAIETYLAKGYTKEWINQSLTPRRPPARIQTANIG